MARNAKEKKAGQGKEKKAGQADAKQWLRSANPADVARLAGDDFEYGDTLTGLMAEGFKVPPSADVDYSWGFFKQVKGHVFHKLRRQPRRAGK